MRFHLQKIPSIHLFIYSIIAALVWSCRQSSPPAVSQSPQKVDNRAAHTEKNGRGGNLMQWNPVWFISFHLIGWNIS